MEWTKIFWIIGTCAFLCALVMIIKKIGQQGQKTGPESLYPDSLCDEDYQEEPWDHFRQFVWWRWFSTLAEFGPNGWGKIGTGSAVKPDPEPSVKHKVKLRPGRGVYRVKITRRCPGAPWTSFCKLVKDVTDDYTPKKK